jgi:hypothetical protein
MALGQASSSNNWRPVCPTASRQSRACVSAAIPQAHPLALGQPLPPLPVRLSETHHVTLDLEASYEETCRMLHMT